MKHIILLTVGLALTMPMHAEEEKAAGAEKGKANGKAKLEAMFAKKDTDGNGSLSKEEFVAKAKDAGKAETAFTKKDKDGNGQISKEEFTAPPERGGKGRKKKGQ